MVGPYFFLLYLHFLIKYVYVLELVSNIELSLEEAISIIANNDKVVIEKESDFIVKNSFDFLSKFSLDKVIYGINTGLGPMAQYKIEDDKIKELQYNLIRSHATGIGEKIPDLYVKASMLVRLKAIMQGRSGIHPSSVNLLKDLINNNIFPLIPEHGGVGSSGDLIQLSHIALVLIGEGHVTYKGELRNTKDVFAELGLKPIEIKLREGLSLINGTSVMTGIGLINVHKAEQLFNWSTVASVMLNEIVESFDDHFSEELNRVKKHSGQRYVAKK